MIALAFIEANDYEVPPCRGSDGTHRAIVVYQVAFHLKRRDLGPLRDSQDQSGIVCPFEDFELLRVLQPQH